MDVDRLSYLFHQHMSGQASEKEEEELALLVLQDRYKEQVMLMMEKNWEDWNEVPNAAPVEQKPIFSIGSRFLKYAAAILIISGICTYLVINFRNNKSEAPLAKSTTEKNISAPSSSKAVLTLADGRKVYLNDIINDTIANQGSVAILKTDNGEISYRGRTNDNELQYNTLTVPRGSKIAVIVLSDGTKVFLNAASSLKYPVAFGDNERSVEISGEAYFEVAKNAKKKFIVKEGSIFTEVLGTQFNVNTYNDEEEKRITLIDGSVRVGQDNRSAIIKPREQISISANNFKINKNINTEQVVAWKNGSFNFNGLKIEETMRLLARWYDLDVVYQNGVPSVKVEGEIGKDLTLNQVLKILSDMEVHFRLEGKKLIILK